MIRYTLNHLMIHKRNLKRDSLTEIYIKVIKANGINSCLHTYCYKDVMDK